MPFSEFDSEVERVGGDFLGDEGGCGFLSLQSQSRLFQPILCHAVGEDIDYFRLQLRVCFRSSQEFFACALIKSRRVQFASADVPPAWQGCGNEQARRSLLPDESLHVLRRNEFLFRRSEGIRQIGERPYQEGSPSGSSTDSDQARNSPDLLDSLNRNR